MVRGGILVLGDQCPPMQLPTAEGQSGDVGCYFRGPRPSRSPWGRSGIIKLKLEYETPESYLQNELLFVKIRQEMAKLEVIF